MESTPLRLVANALGALPAEATWAQVDLAVHRARLPAEPTAAHTLVAVWHHGNRTDRPDSVWLRVDQDGRRKTKAHPEGRLDVWRAYGARYDDGGPVYDDWSGLARRAARVAVLTATDV